MYGLRTHLKQSTLAAHERLENHPTMRAYAGGQLAPARYRQLLLALQEFWCAAQPASRELPGDYHDCLSEYRLALAADAGEQAPTRPARQFDEIAYFYLLLGSSHGARYMLNAAERRAGGQSHLHVLAEHGRRLWSPFVKTEIRRVDERRTAAVVQAAEAMFNALHLHIENKKIV